ncbi:hypothetical protein AGMMS49543_13370 [Betaproteobacteria bacterium]|nr:hypothetical protein AGMMS49543_13370 [Betaproteobacteria bacterium]GHU10262.1 hypothetical protein AGMMS50225_13260 [Betaproteobacteria bacterium]GHU20724.1 hypothetical protein AGMMS50243_16330 [Betaproteobacteria bacterium]GHU25182.1 hypothetical protein FACS189488_11560 [Betaproteobacteria bacterium]GHU32700.1 hypothetical protein FACS189497_14400 [Betaproteobacteria bacterium]
MQAQRLLAIHGWYWLRDGFMLWRKNAAFLSFLIFAYLLVLLVATALPTIGQVVCQLMLPALSVGVLDGCRLTDEKNKPVIEEIPPALFRYFRRGPRLIALMLVGVINLVAGMLILQGSTLIDGGLFRGVLSNTIEFTPTIAETPSFQLAVLVSFALLCVVQMAYWFAPALAGWWNISAPKAMFFSLLSVVRNWRAFLMYSLALTVFGMIVPALVIGIVQVIVTGLASLLLLLYLMIAIPVLIASLYFSIRSIFGLPDQPPTP